MLHFACLAFVALMLGILPASAAKRALVIGNNSYWFCRTVFLEEYCSQLRANFGDEHVNSRKKNGKPVRLTGILKPRRSG